MKTAEDIAKFFEPVITCSIHLDSVLPIQLFRPLCLCFLCSFFTNQPRFILHGIVLKDGCSVRALSMELFRERSLPNPVFSSNGIEVPKFGIPKPAVFIGAYRKPSGMSLKECFNGHIPTPACVSISGLGMI